MSGDPRQDTDATAEQLGAIAAEAGRLLAAVADRAGGRRLKDDGSPTTGADLASEELILRRLAERWPDIPVIAEESFGAPPASDLFFLVDPLDGTKDYLTGAGEYSVNIALVAGSRPIAAAVAAPSVSRVFVAGTAVRIASMSSEGCGQWAPARARAAPESGLVALVSRRHGDDATEACLAALPIAERRVASSAYKFCLIAAGEADIYVRCGPTMEWDTAAGDHLVERAGGIVVEAPGAMPRYGRSDRGFRNGPFAACGDRSVAARLRLPESCA